MMLLALLEGRGIQSALEPAGLHADKIAKLWDVFLVVTAIVYVLVIVALFAALLHRRRTAAVHENEGSRGATTIITIATAISVVILFGLLIASVMTGRGISGTPTNVMQLGVSGHQWWWQVEYDDPDLSKRIMSANEIYIPVGVPVLIHLRSTDVIHSFWVPSLNGKRDLIPGHTNAIVLKADRPGVYRGQCAEFCGVQHAKMAFWVTALPRAEFDRWVDRQRLSSKIPSTPAQREGQDVFMRSPCPLCHTIRGTDANGNTAPDLTHLASRRSLAAGTIPNRRGFLAGWILDPQHIKAGNQMPPMTLRPGELEPLLAYLESLE
jgi:cytochrome c oxidase subunit 2